MIFIGLLGLNELLDVFDEYSPNMGLFPATSTIGNSDLATTQRYIRLDASDLSGATSSLELDLDSKGRILSFDKELSKKP